MDSLQRTVVITCEFFTPKEKDSVGVVCKSMGGDAKLETRFRLNTDVGVVRVLVQRLLAKKLNTFAENIVLISVDGMCLCDWTDEMIQHAGLAPSLDEISWLDTRMHYYMFNSSIKKHSLFEDLLVIV